MDKLLIGNDIVNLNLTRCQSKHRDKRFINRVFNDYEKIYLNTCLRNSKPIWMMWAAKEAAFKALQKIDLELIFSPIKFTVEYEVTSLEPTSTHEIYRDIFISGRVKYEDKFLHAFWQIGLNYLHCICLYSATITRITIAPNIDYHIFDIDSSSYTIESQQTKDKAITYLLHHGFSGDLTINRTQQIIAGRTVKTPPILLQNGIHLQATDISLSHDHGFGAIAYVNNY